MVDVGAILSEYDAVQTLYADLGPKLENLLQELLVEDQLQVHSVTSRLKTRESVDRKVRTATTDYTGLAAVTDVLGVRVITYFPSDVDRVADVVENEFDIDRANSIDKRAALAPDTFGYLSLHYVAKLPTKRLGLTEYKRFAPCVFEIQIRSVLQHAWAEVEHDLGYKTEGEVPREIRRRFSQIAGLLEVADEGFDEIRRRLRSYEERLATASEDDLSAATVDRASVLRFITTSPTVAAIDKTIGEVAGVGVEENPDYAGGLARDLQLVGFDTIGEVGRALDRRAEFVTRFARSWLDSESPYHSPPYEDDDEADRGRSPFSTGISLFYLAYVHAAEAGRSNLFNYLIAANIGHPAEDKEELADAICSLYHHLAGGD